MPSMRELDASLVKPLEGAEIRRYTAYGTIEAGEAVYLNSSGYAVVTAADAAATNFAIGVALQDVASGQRVDVVTRGPVLCLTGATPGSLCYTMNTTDDGEIDQTGGT